MSETMVKSRCFGGVCAVVLLCGSLAVGQHPFVDGSTKKAKAEEKSAEKTLEDYIAAALKNNPEIRIAEVKVREVEAELYRVRLQVIQKVVTTFNAMRGQRKQTVEDLEKKITDLEKHLKSLPANAPERNPVNVMIRQVMSERAKAQAESMSPAGIELRYLTGEQPANLLLDRSEGAVQALSRALSERMFLAETEPKQPPKPQATPMAEKLRKALDTPIKINFENKTPADILKEFQGALGGVPIRIRTDLKIMVQPLTVKLSEPISLGAAFQLLEDETKHLQFLVREYGIIILHLHQEEPPPGAEGLIDFWKGISRRSRGGLFQRGPGGQP